jgi:hypothetical protein
LAFGERNIVNFLFLVVVVENRIADASLFKDDV